MKRILIAIMAIMLVLSLAACQPKMLIVDKDDVAGTEQPGDDTEDPGKTDEPGDVTDGTSDDQGNDDETPDDGNPAENPDDGDAADGKPDETPDEEGNQEVNEPEAPQSPEKE